MSGRRNFGRWALYIGCLTAALGAVGYYSLEYVPSQREYFLNLRFRALAVIGDQFRSKVTGLAQSIDHATKPGEDAIAQYVAAMVPDLTLDCDSGRPADTAAIDGDTVRFAAQAGCTATAAISKILSHSVNDELFDDVLIADAAGRIVYQRAESSPRILSLADLSKRGADPKSTTVEASGSDADALRTVQLDSSTYALLLEPVVIPAAGTILKPVSLTLAGLTRSDRLAAEARHVAPKHLLLIFAPLIVVLLSGPFLKILLLTRTGRLAFHDVVLLALFTMFAAAIVTIVFVSWHDYDLAAERTDPQMSRFADALEKDIVLDLQVMRNTIEAFDDALPADLTKHSTRYRTDIWMSELRPIASQFFPLDFVFWTNAGGCQAVKWSTKRINTKLINQIPEAHFQSVTSGAVSALDDAPRKRFALQARISPTTSQLIVIMDAPSKRHDSIAGCRQSEASPIVSVAMVAPIPSLDSPVVAPRAGFAIFEPDGKVIFHSVPERNLHENLFEEMRHPEPWRAAVAMRSERSDFAYYRGRKYDFHVQPFRRLTGSSWNIATFREMEPEQAVIGLVWTETVVWYLALVAILIAGFALAFLTARVAFRTPWRKQRDFILARLWPQPGREKLYNSLAAQLGVFSAAALAAEIFAARDPLRWAGWLLPFLPIAALGAVLLITVRLWPYDNGAWKGAIRPVAQPAYIACLALCVILLAVVPAAGLFRVCQAFETRLDLMHWQQELANQFEARQLRRAAELRSSPSYSPEASKFLLESYSTALDGPDHRWARPAHLKTFWRTTIATSRDLPEWRPAWWDRLLTFTRPEAQVDAVESGALARRNASADRPPWPCRWFEGPKRELVVRCNSPVEPPVEIASTMPAGSIPSNPAWWLGAAVLMGCACAWYGLAFRRVFVLDLRFNPLPPLDQEPKTFEGEKHLIVLGLPLSHKDKAVRDWLGYTPPRVNLYEERFHQYWLEETLARVESELRPTAARAATVGGSAIDTAPAPVWAHISNLETKLRNPEDRRVLADLFEKLFTLRIGERRVNVIVTSAVDPIFHFDSVLQNERVLTFEHPLSEHEVQRFARILYNFRKVTAEKEDTAAPSGNPAVFKECSSHERLLAIGNEVAARAGGAEAEDLLPMIAERSRALYKLYWSSCTRSEKLILIQLAQTGFMNPHCVDTIEVLMRKGLVLRHPQPRIINETFRQFLIAVESPETVRKWECEAGESSWATIRNIALVLAAVGLAVLALTQNQAMQTITAVLTGVGGVIAGLLRLAGFFGGRRAAPTAVPPA